MTISLSGLFFGPPCSHMSCVSNVVAPSAPTYQLSSSHCHATVIDAFYCAIV